MNFQDKFKPGDIICSDQFHNGLCMIVEDGEVGIINGKFRYRCSELIREEQIWGAYECSLASYNKEYKWRLATDADIAKYIARHVKVKIGKVGEYEVFKEDRELMFVHDCYDSFYLSKKELLKLKQIIDNELEIE